MEIFSNSYNQPVNFYSKNTGNNIGVYIEKENQISGNNFFMQETAKQENIKAITNPVKRRRKNKRLNTIDTDYLPEEELDYSNKDTAKSENFFMEKRDIVKDIQEKCIKIVEETPIINYFFLRRKEKEIKKTLETLSNINQDVDELMNTAVPYGENQEVYNNIAKNLIEAANIIGKANRIR